MEIKYKNRKLKKQLTDSKELLKAFGKVSKKLSRRITNLQNASCLADIQKIPAANCHELMGNRKGEFAIDISPNYRLIFEPDEDPLPLKPDGGLAWEQITKIKINEIEDYH